MSAKKSAFPVEPDSIRVSVDAWVESLESKTGELTRLGEIFYVTEDEEDFPDAVLTKGIQIAHLDRLYFECNDFSRAGDAILERHENYSPDGVPERLRVDNIRLRHPLLSREDAVRYNQLMLQAQFTYPDVISYLDSQIRRQGYSDAMSWLQPIASALDECRPKDGIHSLDEEDEDLRGIPPQWGFHKIDSVWETSEDKSYFEKQPNLVQRLLTTPKRCQTLEQLAKLGKACYLAENAAHQKPYQQVYLSLSNTQKAVFWTNYELRKKGLTLSEPYTPTAKGLYQQIQRALPNDMKRIKRGLWKIQHAEINILNPPKDDEWTLLWNAVKGKEYQFNHPLPNIPGCESRCGYCYQTKGEMYRSRIDLRTGKPEAEYSGTTGQLHCLTCDRY